MPGSTPSLPAMSDVRPASSAATTPVPLFLVVLRHPGSGPTAGRTRMRNPNTSLAGDATTRYEICPSKGTIGDDRDHRARATQGDPLTGQTNDSSPGTAPARVHVIRDGLAAHLPDIDPEETAQWLDSFDACSTPPASSAPAT